MASYSSTSNPNSTVPGGGVIDSFQTTGEGFAGDKKNDFSSATGGADPFSERPNSKSVEQVEEEREGGKKGTSELAAPGFPYARRDGVGARLVLSCVAVGGRRRDSAEADLFLTWFWTVGLGQKIKEKLSGGGGGGSSSSA